MPINNLTNSNNEILSNYTKALGNLGTVSEQKPQCAPECLSAKHHICSETMVASAEGSG